VEKHHKPSDPKMPTRGKIALGFSINIHNFHIIIVNKIFSHLRSAFPHIKYTDTYILFWTLSTMFFTLRSVFSISSILLQA
jgi:hypothetical protein